MLVWPEYLDRARNKLHISRNLLVQEVADSQDPLVKHYASPAHWEFVMDELLESNVYWMRDICFPEAPS